VPELAPARARLIVMGTSEFAVPSLEQLMGLGHDVVAVYTQPPRPAGRGQEPRRTAMHAAAARLGLRVETPASLGEPGVQQELRELAADLAVVGAYGLLLPPAVLEAPRLGCINLHPSLLPRWRGAAPIERAILAGDTETGLTIFQMEEGLDTGPILACRAVPIGPADTASELHRRLAGLAAEMLPATIDSLLGGTARPVSQPTDGVTYAPKLERDEGQIDFRLPAADIDRRLRALNPRPGCWCEVRGERLMLLAGEATGGRGEPGTVIGEPLDVACGTGALRLTKVQRPGRRPMAVEDFLRGFPLRRGDRLG
jgi:methionyl-tRNA formyltransferase